MSLPSADSDKQSWEAYWMAMTKQARERAKQMTSPGHKAMLLDLARTYLRLAADWGEAESPSPMKH